MSELAQSEGINLNALDSMVYSYMLCEGLTEDSGGNDSGREIKRKGLMIRDLINAGELHQARNLIQEVSPDILKDSEIQFRLNKQILIELLRKGNSRSEQDALKWMKTELAPSAQNAFPEAYDEFKKTLLMFVFSEEKANSPVSYEWSPAARQTLAELIYSTVRLTLGFKDPDLVNLLKYLLLHAKKWQGEGETSEQEKELLQKIYINSRLPVPISVSEYQTTSSLPEDDLMVPKSFRRAIESGVNVSREVAEDALRRSRGDVSAAFESELGRSKINTEELSSLVLEYAGYRGMLQFSESDSEDFDAKEEFHHDSKKDGELAMDAQFNGDGEKHGYPIKKLKRSEYKCDPNLKLILKLLKKVRNGKYMETIEHVREIDATIEHRYPQLMFELWRFEVLRVAILGNHDVALDLLRKNLTPLVKLNSDLFVDLQETLNFLVSPKAEQPSTSKLCSALQAALQQSMNLPGPKLIHFLKFLLEKHQEWFKKNNFQDIFSKNLGIDVLLHGSAEIRLSPSIQPPPPDRPTGEAVDSMEWGSASSDESLDISEGLISQVMSILNFPREHAIELLRQHDGNLELAVNQVLTQSDEQ